MERNTIVLSIIIPVYNTPIKYFKECLESIKSSKIKYPYEIIIVNDGSSNQEIIDFLNHYTDENTIIIHKENSGVSATRNIGLEKAKGKYILCLDSDDILLPEINSAIQFLDNNLEYDILYCDTPFFGDVNFTIYKKSYSKFRNIYIRMQPSISTILKKEIINNNKIFFKENMNIGEDWDFWARLSSLNAKFKYFNTSFFKYRRILNGDSLSQKEHTQTEIVANKIKSQFNPHKEITLKEINQYIINNFKDDPKLFIKMLVILFTPPLIINLLKLKNDTVLSK